MRPAGFLSSKRRRILASECKRTSGCRENSGKLLPRRCNSSRSYSQVAVDTARSVVASSRRAEPQSDSELYCELCQRREFHPAVILKAMDMRGRAPLLYSLAPLGIQNGGRNWGKTKEFQGEGRPAGNISNLRAAARPPGEHHWRWAKDAADPLRRARTARWAVAPNGLRLVR
jgi:hypothetical protein